jgi:hypothetical protein
MCNLKNVRMVNRPLFSRCFPVAALGAAILLLVGCSEEESTPGYVPGLGEIMTLNQMRHAKLWLAGQQGNWPLAEYELDELEEGFQDVVKYHPTHEGSPLPIKDLVPRLTTGPLAEIRSAVEEENSEAFTKAFDDLTAACNSCHQTTNFGFNVVTRPTGNSFTNQNFAPSPSEGDGG